MIILVTVAASLAFGSPVGGSPRQPPGSISGMITDTAGRGLPGATVTVASADGQQRITATDRSGRYRIDGLTPGPSTLEVRMAGFDTRVAKATVSPGTNNFWNGTVLVAPAFGGVSIERQVMQFTSLEAVDCGRYTAPTSEAALRRSLDCAVTSAAARRPFSMIVQFAAGASHDGEGLLSGADGVVQLFEYRKGGVSFRATPCPSPRLRARLTRRGQDSLFTCDA
jgi:hypothetical protein